MFAASEKFDTNSRLSSIGFIRSLRLVVGPYLFTVVTGVQFPQRVQNTSRAHNSMVECRPFKSSVPSSSLGALIYRGNSSTARILGFKLRGGGSIPSSPANTIFWGIAKWQGSGLWNHHRRFESFYPNNWSYSYFHEPVTQW